MAGYEVSVGRGFVARAVGRAGRAGEAGGGGVEPDTGGAGGGDTGAERHERTEEWAGYRNGYRPRTLYTRVGPVTLLVPQTREGAFDGDFQTLPAERTGVRAGVDGNGRAGRVDTQGLGDHRGTVRGELFEIDGQRAVCGAGRTRGAFNERRLEGATHPFVLVDALFVKSREGDRVVSRAALVVSGIRSDGYREILGVKIGDTESFATWDETFRWLKGRGLQG